jgi:lipopolysaccharide transport system ATP-binding protein
VSNFAIQALDLCKKYRIGENLAFHTTLRDFVSDSLMSTLYKPIKLYRDGYKKKKGINGSSIWALKDVTFEINQGDVVGIIGHNGAGKSTLLRILSFVTEPTTGYVQVRGRVGSLLEIGTGFHSELTGRENIYLSGAILGMKKSEIVRKFDDIVSFAGVEKFIDTQIKHYSSGMYMRLGFAVAAYLDPEILLVDEVLAVGDAEFQQKCIGSMQSVANSGRTVVVVSHNMAVVESLCRTALWIDNGQLRAKGKTREVISEYMTYSQTVASQSLLNHLHNDNNPVAKFTSINITDIKGKSEREFRSGNTIVIKLEIKADYLIKKPNISVEIRTPYSQLISRVSTRETGFDIPFLEGSCNLSCYINNPNLLPGRYYIKLILADLSNKIHDEIHTASFIDVTEADVYGTGLLVGQDSGIVFLPTKWILKDEI